jgi:hypothetical protein
MEWEFDALFGKAKLYAQRANEEKLDSALFGFWMSLCVEILGRAALAKIHPVLLADPTGEGNIHYVFGVNPKSNPKSVHAKTVFARCSVLVKDFTDRMAGHCLLLADRRNKELHGGSAAFEGVDPSTWLPQTYEVFDVLLKHVGVGADDFLGKEHAAVASRMLQDRRDHIEKEVKDRISKAKKDFDALEGKDKGERIAKTEAALKRWISSTPLGQSADCPACGFAGALHGESLNRGPAKVSEEDGTITREVRVLPNKFRCAVCGLKLDGYQELLQAGLGKVFTTEEEEDPIEFFGIIPEEHIDIDKVVQEYYAEEMYGYQNE